MKKCLFCAEETQDEVIKCRYCSKFLDEKSLQEAFLIKKTTDKFSIKKMENVV